MQKRSFLLSAIRGGSSLELALPIESSIALCSTTRVIEGFD